MIHKFRWFYPWLSLFKSWSMSCEFFNRSFFSFLLNFDHQWLFGFWIRHLSCIHHGAFRVSDVISRPVRCWLKHSFWRRKLVIVDRAFKLIMLLYFELHKLLLIPLLIFLGGICFSLLEARIDLLIPITWWLQYRLRNHVPNLSFSNRRFYLWFTYRALPRPLSLSKVRLQNSSRSMGYSSNDFGLAAWRVCRGFCGGGDVLVWRALGRAVLLEIDLARLFACWVVVFVLFAFH